MPFNLPRPKSKMAQLPGDLRTEAQAADFLGVSVTVLRGCRRRGEIVVPKFASGFAYQSFDLVRLRMENKTIMEKSKYVLCKPQIDAEWEAIPFELLPSPPEFEEVKPGHAKHREKNQWKHRCLWCGHWSSELRQRFCKRCLRHYNRNSAPDTQDIWTYAMERQLRVQKQQRKAK